MKRKRCTEEQTTDILRQVDAGRKPDELAREHGMSVGTFYAWKAKFGGMSVSEAQRLRALEEENRRLKTLVTAFCLTRMLQAVVEKKLGVAEKRGEVARLEQEFEASERRACRLLGQPRRTHRYSSSGLDLTQLRARIRKHAYEAPRRGYRRLWDTLRLQFSAIGLRRVYRLYRLEGLSMRREKDEARPSR